MKAPSLKTIVGGIGREKEALDQFGLAPSLAALRSRHKHGQGKADWIIRKVRTPVNQPNGSEPKDFLKMKSDLG
jgi:hypothetical protein